MMTDQKRTMKHLTRNEFASPLQPPAGGSRWSKPATMGIAKRRD